MAVLETIGGVLAFLVYAYLLYRQNKIMEEQNRIMREQAGGSSATASPRWPWTTYWPMALMAALTLATWAGAGLIFYLRKPVVIQRVVEKPVEKIVSQNCPAPTGNATSTKRQPSEPKQKLMQPALQQSNSGGVNIEQATTGQNSPIVNSPITVGDVPKRISPADLANVTQYLAKAKVKARIRISVFQSSNAVRFADDMYKAFKDAGWKMEDEGVNEGIGLGSPRGKYQGVQINCKGSALAPNEQVQLRDDEPAYYVSMVLEALKVPHHFMRDPNQDADFISLLFVALPE